MWRYRRRRYRDRDGARGSWFGFRRASLRHVIVIGLIVVLALIAAKMLMG
jgi:hypothetical protein